MKILYAIQGTGNGHLSRARDIIPILQSKGEVDILISGNQSDVQLPFEIKYKLKGLGFVFGKKGGIDFLETYKKSSLRSLFREINNLPVEKYDIVINDFEPVSAWACYTKNKPCVALSHQAAVLNSKAPQPNHTDILGRSVLKNYAPATIQYGFHFRQYDKNIFTPVIRKQVRELKPENNGYYTVYLPAYSDEKIIKVLSEIKNVQWQVFSKHNKKNKQDNNIKIFPINNENFVTSMAGAAGILCGAGFETPAEALFLKKKLLVIPMKRQFEQHCNAAALAKLNVPVIKSLKKKYLTKIKDWISDETIVTVNFPDITEEIINTVFKKYFAASNKQEVLPGKKISSFKKFKNLTAKKILRQFMPS